MEDRAGPDLYLWNCWLLSITQPPPRMSCSHRLTLRPPLVYYSTRAPSVTPPMITSHPPQTQTVIVLNIIINKKPSRFSSFFPWSTYHGEEYWLITLDRSVYCIYSICLPYVNYCLYDCQRCFLTKHFIQVALLLGAGPAIVMTPFLRGGDGFSSQKAVARAPRRKESNQVVYEKWHVTMATLRTQAPYFACFEAVP